MFDSATDSLFIQRLSHGHSARHSSKSAVTVGRVRRLSSCHGHQYVTLWPQLLPRTPFCPSGLITLHCSAPLFIGRGQGGYSPTGPVSPAVASVWRACVVTPFYAAWRYPPSGFFTRRVHFWPFAGQPFLHPRIAGEACVYFTYLLRQVGI